MERTLNLVTEFSFDINGLANGEKRWKMTKIQDALAHQKLIKTLKNLAMLFEITERLSV